MGLWHCPVPLPHFCGCTFRNHVVGGPDLCIWQPYEAIQRRAAKDHTTFAWSFDDFDLTTAAQYAVQKSAAIVFINSDSGEDYITVDGNQGDRYVLNVV